MHLGPDADAHGMVFAKRHRIWCGEQHFPFVSDVLWYNYLKLKTGGKGYVAELEVSIPCRPYCIITNKPKS